MNTTLKLMPIYVLLMVTATIGIEIYCECNVDLESYLPLLTAIGLGGIPLSIVKKSIEAKKEIDMEKFKNSIKSDKG